jgi:NADH:ubiquinone oxidoreductase subunit F (NADH-binding)
MVSGGPPPGKQFKAWAPSGPSSGYLPASMMDVPLSFKALAAAGSMLGSGTIVVCAEGRCMLDMALNAVRFFRDGVLRKMCALPCGIAEDG